MLMCVCARLLYSGARLLVAFLVAPLLGCCIVSVSMARLVGKYCRGPTEVK